MSIFTAIENRERGVFVLNGGPPESKVIVISNPTVNHIAVLILGLRAG